MTADERREYQRRYRETHRDEIRAAQRAWKAANREQVRAAGRKYAAENRVRLRENSRRWYAANREHSKAQHQAWRAAHPEQWQKLSREGRRRYVLKQYGLTVAEYDLLLTTQDGKCAICHRAEWKRQHGKLRRLSVDHDHATGRRRALLCHRCNGLLGHAEDDAAVLRAAA